MFISWGTPNDENYYTMNFKGENLESIHEMGVMILVFCPKTRAVETGEISKANNKVLPIFLSLVQSFKNLAASKLK